MTSGRLLLKRLAENNDRETDIIIDSGASEHVVNKMDYLTDVKEVSPITVELVNGTGLTASKQGIVQVRLTEKRPITCKAYYTEFINLNLLSCSCLEDNEVTRIFASEKSKLNEMFDRNDVLGKFSHTRSDENFAGHVKMPLQK